VCAATISGCLDFQKTWSFVSQSQADFYRNMLVNAMKRCVSRHHKTDIHSEVDEKKLKDILSIKRADVMYDRHLSCLKSFYGANANQPAEYAKNNKFSKTRCHDIALCSTDESWYEGVSNPDACEFPLKETRGQYTTPARLCVSDIKTTTLMIHARDDTLVSYDWSVDWDRAGENQHIISVVTQRGGHVGFHEWKGWLTGLTWAEQVVMDYVSTMLAMNAQTGFMIDVLQRSQNQSLLRSGEEVGSPLRPSEVSRLCSTSNVVAPESSYRDEESGWHKSNGNFNETFEANYWEVESAANDAGSWRITSRSNSGNSVGLSGFI
jgi:hypothetical protein